jgi:hypothetical protein
MHELAVAVAATGRSTEIRGTFHPPTLRALSESAGAFPITDPASREPVTGDVVLIPEGIVDPLPFASLGLSGARAIVMMLAPPGLIGWPFTQGWTRPDPHDAPIESVGRPEHFRAIAATGFELWTNSERIGAAAEAGGTPCVVLGTGRPGEPPTPKEKTHDLAVVRSNRWGDAAEAIAIATGRSTIEIDDVTNEEMIESLGSARILVWPARLEGRARIAREARLVGTVPVSLSSNPYAEGLDESMGASVVDTPEEMPAAIEKLLADPGRLTALSGRAIRSARAQTDWSAFVRRVDAALSTPRPAEDGRGARAEFGMRARAIDHDLHRQIEELETIKASLQRENAEQNERADLLARDVRSLTARSNAAEDRYARLRLRKAVRVGLAVSSAVRPLVRPFRRKRQTH